MKQINTKSGFSLIELMVVVAIIGVLVAVIGPNLTGFQAKAKQTNAKTELSGLYTAQKTFNTEYGIYHGYLPYIGFIPEGMPTAAAGADCYPAAASLVPRTYRTGFNGNGGAPHNARVLGLPAITCQDIFYEATTNDNAFIAVGGMALANLVPSDAPNAFMAQSIGRISDKPGVPGLDVWTIDHNRSLQNRQRGF